ncbi:DoxX family protein [Micromonospora sp. KC723]|uniref:DoxX family protein n=1 Tax=Micromonospora sp. KC723 TaxID=2530381 RepID=UPI00104F941B|nr:DoxX family protein [Micromonospora sp. KC723]TDB73758.1 DoxX family protein [Micromonospora sp. KC723]
MTLPTPVRDVAILLARIGIGIVFFAHGWQKLVTNGVDGTAAFFGEAGVPLPTLSAWFATLVELAGGAALIVGAGVTVAGLLLALNMAGAFLFVHAGNGLFVDQGGYEFVLALGAASLLLAGVGAGRFSVDHLLFGRRARATGTAPA